MKNIFFSGPSKMAFIVAVIGEEQIRSGRLKSRCLSRFWDRQRKKSRKYIIISFFRLDTLRFRDP